MEIDTTPTVDPTEIPPVILLQHRGFIFTIFQQIKLIDGEISKKENVIFAQDADMFFNQPLSFFMDAIKDHFSIKNEDVVIEFPSLSLHLHQDSIYSQSLTLNDFYQLYVASCMSQFITIPNMDPFRIHLRKDSIGFYNHYTSLIDKAKTVKNIENPFKDKGTPMEPIVLSGSSDDDDTPLPLSDESEDDEEMESLSNDPVVILEDDSDSPHDLPNDSQDETSFTEPKSGYSTC